MLKIDYTISIPADYSVSPVSQCLTSREISANEILRIQFDQRPSWQKAIDLIASLFRQVQYFIVCLYHQQKQDVQLGRQVEWKANAQGLVVFLHELGGSPATWHPQLSLLQRDRVDVFAPEIYQKGMCSLDEAGTPILSILLKYTQKNPGKPLCLLGVSNGSRIAIWLETMLRQHAPLTPVMVSTVAGVHWGCSRMNLLDRWGVAKWIYSDPLREEIKYGSEKAKELMNRVCAPLPLGCASRYYEFYASTDDLTVPDLDSSLPRINKGERFYIVHGQGHTSIVGAVAERQINSCRQWINNRSLA